MPVGLDAGCGADGATLVPYEASTVADWQVTSPKRRLRPMLELVATAIAGAAVTAGGALIRRRQTAREALIEVNRTRDARLARLATDREAAMADARARAEVRRARTVEALERAREDAAATQGRLALLEGATGAREEALDERFGEMDERFAELKSRQKEIIRLERSLTDLDHELDEAVARQSGRTREQVIAELGEVLSGEAAMSAQKAMRSMEERTDAMREALATQTMEAACQRYGTGLNVARLQSTVPFPEVKKVAERLLGDDRATLRALAEATGVEYQPQDGDIFLVKAADPYQREVGRLAYERLVKGGQIEPEIAIRLAQKAATDLDRTVRDAGAKAAKMLKVDRMHPEILRLVGMLLYRTSYTQNQWTHAIETAHLCALMARDLGVDVTLARRSALIHDIGKVLYEETERVGSHAVTGAAFATAHGEKPDVVHPVAAHHNDEAPSTALAHLVAAADALSGARPGARRETEEAFGSRVEDFERICSEYREIEAAYVIQGGREVRVLVDPRKLDDIGAAELSMEIAERIESEVTYPGQVKVTVLRETRASAVARR